MIINEISILISPYGNKLIDLLVPAEVVDELKAYSSHLPSLQLSDRSICDLELLATGAFSPLDRFMGYEDHQSVLDGMRLTSGHLFPIPVTLPVDPGSDIRLDQEIALRDAKNEYGPYKVWTVELKIPLLKLGGAKKTGDAIGFDIVWRDADRERKGGDWRPEVTTAVWRWAGRSTSLGTLFFGK